MKICKIFLFLFVAIGGCKLKNQSQYLSVSNVIDKLDAFDNQEVFVEGYFNLENEDIGIYNDIGSYDRRDSNKSLWMQIKNPSDFFKYNGKFIYVKGEIQTDHKGHFDLWPASIEVKCISTIRSDCF